MKSIALRTELLSRALPTISWGPSLLGKLWPLNVRGMSLLNYYFLVLDFFYFIFSSLVHRPPPVVNQMSFDVSFLVRNPRVHDAVELWIPDPDAGILTPQSHAVRHARSLWDAYSAAAKPECPSVTVPWLSARSRRWQHSPAWSACVPAMRT